MIFFLLNAQFLKNWSILSYSVVLISDVQQSDSVIHVYMFFSHILFHYGLSQIWCSFHVLHSRTLLSIHSKCDSLQLLTPNPQSIPLPLLSLLPTVSLFSMSVSLFLFYRWVHVWHYDFHPILRMRKLRLREMGNLTKSPYQWMEKPTFFTKARGLISEKRDILI